MPSDVDKKYLSNTNAHYEFHESSGLLSQLKTYFHEFYRHRWLTITVAYSELQNSVIRYPMRYAWWILEPLLLLLCYVFLVKVLGRGGPRNGIPFYLFVFVGILPWFWTVKCISGATTLIIKYSGPISQIRFPVMTLVFSHFLYQTILYLASQSVLLVFLFSYSLWPNINWLYWPLLFITHSLLILAIMPFISAFSVFVPDIAKFVPFIVRLWFYGSPILWELKGSLDKFPKALQILYEFNPMTYIFITYRNILLFNQPPSLLNMFYWSLLFLVLLIFSIIFFIKKEKSFARYL